MSVFDNIILATDSYKVRSSRQRTSCGQSALHTHGRGRSPPFVSAPQVSHYKQYPPGTEYVYSVR